MYGTRFGPHSEYRKEVWSVLVDDWFGKYIRATDAVLDLGSGYGEFINTIRCREKFAMDLNPDSPSFLANDVTFLPQDCSARWPLAGTPRSTSCSRATSSNTCRTRWRWGEPWTRFTAACVRAAASSRWDRTSSTCRACTGISGITYVPLTEASLKEALVTRGFTVDVCLGRFLPYTMASGPRYPLALLRAYLKLPLAWRIFGKQFLVVGARP